MSKLTIVCGVKLISFLELYWKHRPEFALMLKPQSKLAQ